LPVTANGQPAFAEYLWNERAGHFAAEAVTVLTFTDHLIADITSFRYPELFARFGLPAQLGPNGGGWRSDREAESRSYAARRWPGPTSGFAAVGFAVAVRGS